MKRFVLTLLLLLSSACFICRADEPRMKYGIDWGFSTNIYRYYYFFYNYVDGAVLDTDSYFLLLAGGHFGVNCGVCFSEKFCVSLHTGYMGIYKKRHMVPVLARFNFHPNGYDSRGFFCFADAGPAFGVTNCQESNGICTIAHLGGAYRLPLGGRFSIDLSLSARAAFDHPRVTDPYGQEVIPSADVRRSDSNHYALEFTAGINF